MKLKTKVTKDGWNAIEHRVQLPKDRIILTMWKGRISLSKYDEDEGRWFIIWDPVEYVPMMLPQERENKFTHWMDLPKEPEYPEDYILE